MPQCSQQIVLKFAIVLHCQQHNDSIIGYHNVFCSCMQVGRLAELSPIYTIRFGHIRSINRNVCITKSHGRTSHTTCRTK